MVHLNQMFYMDIWTIDTDWRKPYPGQWKFELWDGNMKYVFYFNDGFVVNVAEATKLEKSRDVTIMYYVRIFGPSMVTTNPLHGA